MQRLTIIDTPWRIIKLQFNYCKDRNFQGGGQEKLLANGVSIKAHTAYQDVSMQTVSIGN